MFFFFNDTATTEIYTLSLHDALPIFTIRAHQFSETVLNWEHCQATILYTPLRAYIGMKESDFLREHPRFCGTRKFRPYKTWTKSNFQVCFSLTINRMVEMKYLTDRYPMLTCNCTMTITSVNNASVTTIKKWRHQMNMRQKIMSLTNKKFAPFNQWTSPFQKGKFIDHITATARTELKCNNKNCWEHAMAKQLF